MNKADLVPGILKLAVKRPLTPNEAKVLEEVAREAQKARLVVKDARDG